MVTRSRSAKCSPSSAGFISGASSPTALEFASPPETDAPLVGCGALVITPTAGLRAAETPITIDALQAFAKVDIAADDPRYSRPLLASARALADEIGPECEVVLLGSIASAKYVDVLTQVFGERLLFPGDFVGRGDMSRGGLLLRAVRSGEQLQYVPGARGRAARPAPAEAGACQGHPEGRSVAKATLIPTSGTTTLTVSGQSRSG